MYICTYIGKTFFFLFWCWKVHQVDLISTISNKGNSRNESINVISDNLIPPADSISKHLVTFRLRYDGYWGTQGTQRALGHLGTRRIRCTLCIRLLRAFCRD